MATPSRKCAARAPLISTSFLMALGWMQGSGPGTNFTPSACSACANLIGADVGIEPHAGARFAERLELLHQRGGLGEIEKLAQARP